MVARGRQRRLEPVDRIYGIGNWCQSKKRGVEEKLPCGFVDFNKNRRVSVPVAVPPRARKKLTMGTQLFRGDCCVEEKGISPINRLQGAFSREILGAKRKERVQFSFIHFVDKACPGIG